MKNLFLIVSIFLIFSCEKKENAIVENEQIINFKEPKVSLTKNEITIQSFKEFRQAVYQNDLKKVKEFINFPVKSGEIWYLIDENQENNSEKLFTEKDFDKYHSKIFTKEFINGLLKVKSDSIINKDEYFTNKLGDKKFYYRIGVFNEKDKEEGSHIIFDFIKNKEFDSEIDEGEKVMEETVIKYDFEILKNGKIKFKAIYLAG